MATQERLLSPVIDLLDSDQPGILQDWVNHQVNARGFRPDRISRSDIADQSQRFLAGFREAISTGSDIDGPGWEPMRQFLQEFSTAMAHRGFSPKETAGAVMSLKQVLFERLRSALEKNPAQLVTTLSRTSTLLDELGLYTTEVFQRSREQVILRQQQDLMELSTPVVTLWDGILALPLIGTLDSARTQVVMENLLQSIVDTGAEIAVIDITGVPTVDTLTAQHLLKTVAAARLMGADCIISGIRPQIAQTIVHLGVDLGSVVTKPTLADAFMIALRRLGLAVTRANAGAAGSRRAEPATGGDSSPQE